MSSTAPPPAAPRRLVANVAERLRERVFAGEPDERLGSLTDIARAFDVGIVTVQQAARVLEHEGLLEVRRGPGGGYYGRRPDEKSLERALDAYLRLHPDSFEEALDITSLLFIELCGAAARCTDAGLLAELTTLSRDVEACRDDKAVGAFELRLQNLLFRMVDRPIFELLTRVTLRFASAGGRALYDGPDAIARWVEGRRRIVAAILSRDEPLARFEADRRNRQPVLAALRAHPRDG